MQSRPLPETRGRCGAVLGPMMLIDTHCHLTFEPLADEVEAVLQRSCEAGVTGWITVGTSLEDSRKAVELADDSGELCFITSDGQLLHFPVDAVRAQGRGGGGIAGIEGAQGDGH